MERAINSKSYFGRLALVGTIPATGWATAQNSTPGPGADCPNDWHPGTLLPRCFSDEDCQHFFETLTDETCGPVVPPPVGPPAPGNTMNCGAPLTIVMAVCEYWNGLCIKGSCVGVNGSYTPMTHTREIFPMRSPCGGNQEP